MKLNIRLKQTLTKVTLFALVQMPIEAAIFILLTLVGAAPLLTIGLITAPSLIGNIDVG